MCLVTCEPSATEGSTRKQRVKEVLRDEYVEDGFYGRYDPTPRTMVVILFQKEVAVRLYQGGINGENNA